MGKFAPDDTIDAMLDYVALATRIYITKDSGTPTGFTFSLAATALTAGDGGGDFTIADGTSGRKVTITAQSAIDIASSGTAQHIILGFGGTITYITTCTAQYLTSGGTVDIPAFDIQVNDPS